MFIPLHLFPAKAPHSRRQPPCRHSAGASACRASCSHRLPVKTTNEKPPNKMSVVVVNVYLRKRYLAYQVLHIIVWERANGCDCSDKPFRKGVFTLNTLHDVPHSRAHVERKDIAPVPGDASHLQQAEETKQKDWTSNDMTSKPH